MKFVVNYWYLIVILALSLMIAGLFVYIDMLKKDKSLLVSEKLVLATQLSVSELSVKDLSTSIDTQNKAIEKLRSESEQRQKLAQKDLDAAKKSRMVAENKAASLMKEKPSAGKDVCSAANDLINAEIKDAR